MQWNRCCECTSDLGAAQLLVYTPTPVLPDATFSHVTVSVMLSSVSAPTSRLAMPVAPTATTRVGRARPCSTHWPGKDVWSETGRVREH